MNMRPLVRWSVGDSTPQGLDVFREAIRSTPRALGHKYDYIVCSNAKNMASEIESACNREGIKFVQVTWDMFALPQHVCPPNPTGRQGSFWKICPARMRIKSHEIIIDADVIIKKNLPQFEEFLNSKKTMISSENVRCYGKYYSHFYGEKGYNTGIIGLPPDYDFHAELNKAWKWFGSYDNLLSRDEQGLLAATITQIPYIAIPSDVILPFLMEGLQERAEYELENEGNAVSQVIRKIYSSSYDFTYKEYGYHFCQVNRHHHETWNKYISGKFL